jgi:iron(III) transport system ATP-binding protein
VVVFQDYALFPHLSVFENVAYGLRRRRMRDAEIQRRVRDMLKFLGLPDQDRSSPLLLSGGQQQRVALARALVVEPDVLLLDEPLSNLDVKLRVRVRTELKEIQRSLGKTTILVTHDQEEALSLSDRIAVMEAGRIRQIGTPQELYAHPADDFVADFVGIANFIPATIRAVGPDSIVADSPLGPIKAPAKGWSAGQSVMLVIRPMALRLSKLPGENAVKGSVHSMSFLGETRRYIVQVGELRLTADQPFAELAPLEDEIWLNVHEAAGLHILPVINP